MGVVVVVVVAVWRGVPVHQKRSAPMVAWAQRRMQWGSQRQSVAPGRPTEFPPRQGHHAPFRKKGRASCA
jgi:hypothetical protein